MMSRARNARPRLTLALLVSRASSRLSSADSFSSATGRPGFPMASLDHTRCAFSRNFVSGGLALTTSVKHCSAASRSPPFIRWTQPSYFSCTAGSDADWPAPLLAASSTEHTAATRAARLDSDIRIMLDPLASAPAIDGMKRLAATGVVAVAPANGALDAIRGAPTVAESELLDSVKYFRRIPGRSGSRSGSRSTYARCSPSGSASPNTRCSSFSPSARTSRMPRAHSAGARASSSAAEARARRSWSRSRARSPDRRASWAMANGASAWVRRSSPSKSCSHSAAISGGTAWCAAPASGTRAPRRPSAQATPGAAPGVAWALGRLGARVPLAGAAHQAVPPEMAAEWLQLLLGLDLRTHAEAPFAVAQLARLSGDRARDLDEDLRARASAALEEARAPAEWARGIREVRTLGEKDEQRVFGEALPLGLHLA